MTADDATTRLREALDTVVASTLRSAVESVLTINDFTDAILASLADEGGE